MSKHKLLSTAWSLEDIQDAITRFYCGCEKRLEKSAPDEWSVHNPNGERLNTRVVKRGDKFRFEEVQP